MVKSGQLPLWNPYLFCGYPLMATLQVGFFYPLSIIYYLLPFNLAFNYYTIAHYFFAALFMYWLMRYFVLARSSAFISALVFAFSGYMLSMANMNTSLTSLIWLPLIVLFYDKLIKNGLRIRYIVILSFLFGLQFLGGEPTILYLSCLFLFAYGVAEGWGRIKYVFRNTFFLLVPLVLAGLLTAIQLIPFLEVVSQSLRMGKTNYDFIAHRSWPPRELLNLIFPYFFGNPVKHTYLKALMGDKYQLWLLSPYVGLIPMLFFVFSLRRRKRNLIFIGGLMFSLFLALGRFTPVYPLLYKFLPGISYIRYPVKYISLGFFCLAVLIGIGFERLKAFFSMGEKCRKVITVLFGFYLVLTILLLLSTIFRVQLFLFVIGLYPGMLPFRLLVVLWRIVNTNIGAFGNILIYFGLALFTIYLFNKRMISRTLFVVIISLLIIVDLGMANIGINPPGSYSILKNLTPNLWYLAKDPKIVRYFAIRGIVPTENYNETLFNMKDNFAANMPAAHRLTSFMGRESMEPGPFMDFYSKFKDTLASDHRSLADMMNIKYFFLPEKMRQRKFSLLRKKDVKGIKSYLYLNWSVMPRGYLLRSIKVIKDRDQILDYMAGPEYRPKEELILEEEVDVSDRGRWVHFAKVIKHEPNYVKVDISTNKPSMYFLSDTFYPGWKAYVDRKETKIYRANYLFRAVKIEPGIHKLEFVYEPESFKKGAIISLIAILGLFLAAFVGRKSS